MSQSPQLDGEAPAPHPVSLIGELQEASSVEIDTFLQFLASIVKRRLAEEVVVEISSQAS